MARSEDETAFYTDDDGKPGRKLTEEEVELYNETTQHEHPSDAKAEMAKHGLTAEDEVDFMKPGMTIEESIMSSWGPTEGLVDVRRYLIEKRDARRARRANDRD